MDSREPPMPPHIGRYRIERLLGRGAMGRVLLGRDQVLDRQVAVKLLRDDLAIGPEQKAALIDRMRHEAKACARVTHPNIVALFDMGEDASVGLYLVFEYAEGITLKERLTQGPLPIALAAKMAREIGGALSTAHATGVLHRDVKPENIILTEHGSKVADFGIARVPDSTLTRDGGLLGTPAYSAPECIANGSFSTHSDQFSLAATMYEALSQRRAFPGEDAVAVATRIQSDEPPPIAEACGLDPHVDGVLARGLAKEPERRFRARRSRRRARRSAAAGEPARPARCPTCSIATGQPRRPARCGAPSGARQSVRSRHRGAAADEWPARTRTRARIAVVHALPPARAVAWLAPAAREPARPAAAASVRTRAPVAALSASAVPVASAAHPPTAAARTLAADAGTGTEPDGDAGL